MQKLKWDIPPSSHYTPRNKLVSLKIPVSEDMDIAYGDMEFIIEAIRVARKGKAIDPELGSRLNFLQKKLRSVFTDAKFGGKRRSKQSMEAFSMEAFSRE